MIRERQQTAESAGEHDTSKGTQLPLRRAFHTDGRDARWSARRKRDAWMLLLVLLICGSIVISLAERSNLPVARPGTSVTTGTQASTTGVTPASTAVFNVRTAQVRLYPVPSANVGLMQPAVDGRGNVWVGEMNANRFARLDSHSGAVTTWDPPGARNGIMTTTVDTQGNAWFVEQAANYIGRFDPARQAFRTFPLGTAGGHPMGPQALQFDPSGNLWFTAAAGGRIGRLDPATSVVQTWPVPAPRAGVPSTPFGLTVTSNGQVWFGDLTGGAVGHFDPTTDRVTLYHLADPQATVFSMAHDAGGRIWFSEIVPGKLGMIDPVTNRVTELTVPAMPGQPAALYAVVVTHNGDVWFADNGAGSLVRYVPGNATFTFFRLPVAAEAPYGLTLDSAGRLWFTSPNPTTNAVGELTP